MKRIIIVVLIFLSVFAVNAQNVDYLGKAKKYYAEGNCKGAKAYLDLYVKLKLELGGAVDKAVRDFSAEVDKCLEDKDKGSSENVVCTYSVKTVIMPSTTTYVESASSVAQGDHEYVDLGLSVKWATCNVGASKPEDCGDYFAWGETMTKETYTEDNCPTYGLSSKSELQSQGIIDSEGNLTPKYDAARANWGGNWRMPTKSEMHELKDRCTWTWTTQNGVNGYKVKGPNGNSIFLPAAGYRDGSSLYDAGSDGYYWGSTPGESSFASAYYLNFASSYHAVYYGECRDVGRSVRPVLE